MSILTAILTGILAFVGAVVGHFIAFDLSSAAKRREVRRMQAEELAELLSEDVTWLFNYRNDVFFGTKDMPTDQQPHDRGYAIYMLYFKKELVGEMYALSGARHDHVLAMDTARLARMNRAHAESKGLSEVPLTDAEIDRVKTTHSTYYKATLEILDAISVIVDQSLPTKSELGRLYDRLVARVKGTPRQGG